MSLYYLILIVCFTTTFSCISFKSKSEVTNLELREPSEKTIQKVDAALEKVMIFQRTSESLALSEGRELTKDEFKYAIELGIKYPEKVRIQCQWSFPEPQDEELLYEFNRLGFGSWFEGGRTNGYGIFIKSYFPYKNSIIRHELVHVKQGEKLSLKEFTRRYLIEAMTYDYFDMPLEVEAFNAP